MESREFEKMFSLEERYWWFVGRRAIVGSMIEETHLPQGGSSILEVGCGTGGNLALLSQFGETFGLDLPLPLQWCRRREFSRILASSALAIAAKEESFELIVCLDVLEHIEDDLAATKEMLRVCRQGGHLLLTVPAYRFLWSEHDEALAHYRRYSKRELFDLVTGAGFEVERIGFAITFLLIPILVFRLAQKLLAKISPPSRPAVAYIEVPRWLSNFFVLLLRWEAQLLKRFDLPFGVSLVCRARKPNKKSDKKYKGER